MVGPRSNVDVFGSYLAKVGVKPAAKGVAEGEAGAEISVLKTLKEETDAVSVKTLMSRLELPPSTLMRTLATLNESKLVEMHRVGDDEGVALTGLGRSLAD